MRNAAWCRAERKQYTALVSLFFMVLIGVCLGSFGNVLIDRLPAGRSIVGRSRCDGCNRPLSPPELVPLISWIVLRGTCRTCGERIPARVPLVEAASGCIAWFAFANVVSIDAGIDTVAIIDRGQEWPLLHLLSLVGLWALFIIAVIDLRTKTIPDALTLTAAIAGVAFHWLQSNIIPIVPIFIAAAFFGVQWLVSRGRWVGSGDVLLAGAIGALLGTVSATVWMLLLSYIVGAVVAVALLTTKRLRRGDMIPFGPFLVIAAFAVMVFGEWLPGLW